MTGDLTVPEGRTPAPAAEGSLDSGLVRARPKAIAWLVAVPVVAVLVDQVAKQLALTYLTHREPLRLLWGAVWLNLTRNGGAAFSIGSAYTWVFPIITLVVIGVITWLSRDLRSIGWAIGFGLILGGALGNVVDRIFRAPSVFRGHVVDMISLFDPAGRVFPAGAIFNVADSCLFCGVVLLIILELLGRHRDGSRDRGRA